MHSGLKSLGEYLTLLINEQINGSEGAEFRSLTKQAKNYNRWFTEDNVKLRLRTIAKCLLSDSYVNFYSEIKTITNPLMIGVKSEERIPIEEFASLLTILFAGHSFVYQVSDKSDKIIKYIFEKIAVYVPEFKSKINFTDRPFKNIDALYVTHKIEEQTTIQSYLNHHKSLLELRRPSVAVILADETDQSLDLLTLDVVSYFGMGEGNVKKVFLPQNYNLTYFIEKFEKHYNIIEHNAYANNYQYHQSVYLMNSIKHLDNGFLLFKEDKSVNAPTGVLFYEYYDDILLLNNKLQDDLTVSFVLKSEPKLKNEKQFGSSLNQLTMPSEQLIQFLS